MTFDEAKMIVLKQAICEVGAINSHNECFACHARKLDMKQIFDYCAIRLCSNCQLYVEDGELKDAIALIIARLNQGGML